VARVVLAVAVEMDDHIGAGRERSVHSRPEGRDETAIASVALDSVGTGSERDRRGLIAGPVVDDDDVDLPDLVDLARYRCDHGADRRRLVERGMTTASLYPLSGPVGRSARAECPGSLSAVNALNVGHHVELIEPRLVESLAPVHHVASAVA
jgi:hypothetical protein